MKIEKKYVLKILTVILVSMLLILNTTKTYAIIATGTAADSIVEHIERREERMHRTEGGSTSSGTVTDPVQNPDDYKPNNNPESNNTRLISIGGSIIGVIRFIGTALSVIILMVLGIKYMIGTLEEKANYKEAMGPYIIGAIMVFALPNLLSILYDLIVNNITL